MSPLLLTVRIVSPIIRMSYSNTDTQILSQVRWAQIVFRARVQWLWPCHTTHPHHLHWVFPHLVRTVRECVDRNKLKSRSIRTPKSWLRRTTKRSSWVASRRDPAVRIEPPFLLIRTISWQVIRKYYFVLHSQTVAKHTHTHTHTHINKITDTKSLLESGTNS